MAANVDSRVLDYGLSALKSEATHIYICNAEPTTYTAATSTNALGNKNFGAGNVFPAAIANGTPNGRKLTTAAVTDGTVTGTGTATNWAICDSVNSRLLAVGSLAAAQAVTSGNVFTLAAFDIRLPNQ